MTIHVKPHLEAVLKAQVDSGNFPNVEAALEAAILALDDPLTEDGDLSDADADWVKPLLDEAEADVAVNGSLSEDEVWERLKEWRANR